MPFVCEFFYPIHSFAGWIWYGGESVWCYIRRWNCQVQEGCLWSFLLGQQGIYHCFQLVLCFCLHMFVPNSLNMFHLNFTEVFNLHDLVSYNSHCLLNVLLHITLPCWGLLGLWTGKEDWKSCTSNCYHEPPNSQCKWFPLGSDYFTTKATGAQVRHVGTTSFLSHFSNNFLLDEYLNSVSIASLWHSCCVCFLGMSSVAHTPTTLRRKGSSLHLCLPKQRLIIHNPN